MNESSPVRSILLETRIRSFLVCCKTFMTFISYNFGGQFTKNYGTQQKTNTIAMYIRKVKRSDQFDCCFSIGT